MVPFSLRVRRLLLPLARRVLLSVENVIIRLESLDPTILGSDDAHPSVATGQPPAHWVERVRRDAPQLLRPGKVQVPPMLHQGEERGGALYADNDIVTQRDVMQQKGLGKTNQPVMHRSYATAETRKRSYQRRTSQAGLQLRDSRTPITESKVQSPVVVKDDENIPVEHPVVSPQGVSERFRKPARGLTRADGAAPLDSTEPNAKESGALFPQSVRNTDAQDVISKTRHPRMLDQKNGAHHGGHIERPRPVKKVHTVLPTLATASNVERSADADAFVAASMAGHETIDRPMSDNPPLFAPEACPPAKHHEVTIEVAPSEASDDFSLNQWPALLDEQAEAPADRWPDLAVTPDDRYRSTQNAAEVMRRESRMQRLDLEQRGIPWNV